MQPTAAGVTRGVTESFGQDGWLVDERSEPPVIFHWGLARSTTSHPTTIKTRNTGGSSASEMKPADSNDGCSADDSLTRKQDQPSSFVL
jgi:hypothetical protein